MFFKWNIISGYGYMVVLNLNTKDSYDALLNFREVPKEKT
jgi:hypothetical protein